MGAQKTDWTYSILDIVPAFIPIAKGRFRFHHPISTSLSSVLQNIRLKYSYYKGVTMKRSLLASLLGQLHKVWVFTMDLLENNDLSLVNSDLGGQA